MNRFTRREVDFALLTVALAAAAGLASTPKDEATTPFDFAMAGGVSHGLRTGRTSLRIGQAPGLRAEPANPCDAAAVGVRGLDGIRLGYVPHATSLPISGPLQDGAEVRATIIGFLDIQGVSDIPADLVFTDFAFGDPRVRLTAT